MGIFSSICLPITYFYQEASLDCYRVTQNAVIAVIENSFKACQRSSKQSAGTNHTTAGVLLESLRKEEAVCRRGNTQELQVASKALLSDGTEINLGSAHIAASGLKGTMS